MLRMNVRTGFQLRWNDGGGDVARLLFPAAARLLQPHLRIRRRHYFLIAVLVVGLSLLAIDRSKLVRRPVCLFFSRYELYDL